MTPGVPTLGLVVKPSRDLMRCSVALYKGGLVLVSFGWHSRRQELEQGLTGRLKNAKCHDNFRAMLIHFGLRR